jgi:acylphosphatase
VELGLSGYVHNLADGERVEVRAEGDEESLEKFLGYLRVGPPAARVDKVAANWPAYTGSFTGFSVRY